MSLQSDILEEEIDAWHERELLTGQPVPDFWNDLGTSERLASYLVAAGWRKPGVDL